MIGCFYKTTIYLDALINPTTLALPNPYLYTVARISLWALYGFWAGLFATGIWVIGHECGHQAFSESKTINNTVGWILHSAYVIEKHYLGSADRFFMLDLAYLTMLGVSRTQNIMHQLAI